MTVRFLYVFLIVGPVEVFERVIVARTGVEKKRVVHPAEVFRALFCVVVRRLAFPDDFVDEVILAENLIEHDFDVVAGMPVAVVIKTACFLQHAVQLVAAGAHIFDVGLGRFVPVLE